MSAKVCHAVAVRSTRHEQADAARGQEHTECSATVEPLLDGQQHIRAWQRTAGRRVLYIFTWTLAGTAGQQAPIVVVSVPVFGRPPYRPAGGPSARGLLVSRSPRPPRSPRVRQHPGE